MSRSGKFGLRSSTNSRPGSEAVISYGPTPGGGSAVRSRNGVRAGTGAAKTSASALENVASGRVEADRDLAGLVVGFDPADVTAPVAGAHVGARADDPLVEGRPGRAQAEHPLDLVLEVRRPHLAAVGVAEPLAQGERVGPAVLRDLRQVGGEPGDQLGALGALGPAVGEQGRVDEPDRFQRVDLERQRRVEAVRLRGLRDRDRGRRLLLAAARGQAEPGERARSRRRSAPGERMPRRSPGRV